MTRCPVWNLATCGGEGQLLLVLPGKAIGQGLGTGHEADMAGVV